VIAPAVNTPEAPKPEKRTLIQDFTPPHLIPKPGTPEREMHDALHNASSVFEGAHFKAQYGSNGKMSGFTVSGRGVSITRSLSSDGKKVDHAYFELSEARRGDGGAKSFLAETVAAYKKAGYEKVKVHANIDVGGYAWLRYGFKPTNDSNYILRGVVHRKVGDLEAFGHITKAEADEIRNMASKFKFKELATMTKPVASPYRGSSVPIGRHLFLDSNWYGHLELKNASAMRTFEKYAGVSK
jgi:hypothetical protein